jgi:hypothetical protein
VNRLARLAPQMAVVTQAWANHMPRAGATPATMVTATIGIAV